MTSPDTRPIAAAREREVSRLKRFAVRARQLLVARGVLKLLAALVLCCLVSYAVDRVLKLSGASRVVLALAGAGWLFWIAVKEVVRPVVDHWGQLDLASVLDNLIDESTGHSKSFITQRLASLMQLEERVARAEPAEQAFLMRALDKDQHELAEFKYEEQLDTQGGLKRVGLTALVAAVPVVLGLAFPGQASVWFQRWFLGTGEWPQDTYLEFVGAEDDALTVARGEPFEVQVRATDDSKVPREVMLRYAIGGGREEQGVMVQFGENDFRFPFSALEVDAQLWARGGDDRVGPVDVIVRDRPRIIEYTLTATLAEAGFSEELTFTTQDRGQAYLHGTAMRLECATDQPVRDVQALSDGLAEVEIEKLTDRRFALTWLHRDAVPLRLEFASVESGLKARMQRVSFGMRVDRAPRVTLARSGVGERVTPTARIPYAVLAQDDFGLDDVRLALFVGVGVLAGANSSSPRVTYDLYDVPEAGPDGSVEVQRELALEDLGIRVGSVLRLRADARDRCHLGAQDGQSRAVTLRVVEPAQLLAEIVMRLQLTRGKFRRAYEDARDLHDELEQSEQIQAVADVLRRHRLIDRTAWSTNRTVEASLRELELNNLMQEKARLLLESKVLEPLTELHEETLREQRMAFEQLFNQQEVPHADLVARQAKIVEDMQAILEGMEQWDSFMDLVNQLEEVIRLQQDIRTDTLDAGGDR